MAPLDPQFVPRQAWLDTARTTGVHPLARAAAVYGGHPRTPESRRAAPPDLLPGATSRLVSWLDQGPESVLDARIYDGLQAALSSAERNLPPGAPPSDLVDVVSPALDVLAQAHSAQELRRTLREITSAPTVADVLAQPETCDLTPLAGNLARQAALAELLLAAVLDPARVGERKPRLRNALTFVTRLDPSVRLAFETQLLAQIDDPADILAPAVTPADRVAEIVRDPAAAPAPGRHRVGPLLEAMAARLAAHPEDLGALIRYTERFTGTLEAAQLRAGLTVLTLPGRIPPRATPAMGPADGRTAAPVAAVPRPGR